MHLPVFASYKNRVVKMFFFAFFVGWILFLAKFRWGKFSFGREQGKIALKTS